MKPTDKKPLEKPLKVNVSMSLDPDVVNGIKELAEKDERPFSQYVNMLLRRWLEENRKSTSAPLSKKQ